MRTGFATVDLPVPPGSPMGGYVDRRGTSTGVLDPLTVSVLTWSDGHHRAALAVIDVICVNTDLTAAARAAVPDVDLLWIAATHTHSGPETGCQPGGGPTPQPWLDRLVAALRGASARAIATERPTQGVLHAGPLRHVGAVRSAVAPDPVVPLHVLTIGSPDRCDGVLVVLPVHPTILPASNVTVSADLPGAVRRALTERLDGAWVMVATGAAGDISTRHTRQGRGPAELARFGALVAGRCLELLAVPGTAGWSTGERLAWRTASVLLPPRRRPETDAAVLLAGAEAAYRTALGSGDPVAARIAEGRLQGARVAATSAPPAGGLPVEVGALRVGKLALAALPGEPFLALAAAVRGARRGPTAVLAYANGYPGYLPTRTACAAADYEVLASVVAEGSGERLAGVAHDLIVEIFRRCD